MTDPTLMVADEITDPRAPFTPPPELVEQWIAEIWHEGTPVRVAASDLHIAIQAAQWGAAQELEACIDWLDDTDCEDPQEVAQRLRAARRPKPPSLKEQALALIDGNSSYLDDDAMATIRGALEQLPDQATSENV
jgi:hypothetical protein